MLTPQVTTEKTGECEVCDKTDVHITKHYGNMWFCDDCWEKEDALQKSSQSPEAQQARVDAYRASVETAKALDNKIEVRTDLFNAATQSIIDIKAVIDADESITNKPYALAEMLLGRFNHFKQIVFNLNEQIVDANNNQKAIQIYLNQMANTLRAEEREKLKIQDINYKPNPVKPSVPKSIKTSGTRKSGIDKAELAKYAKELGVSEFTLQMLVVSKGITVETAANILRKSIEASKTE